MNTYEQFKNRFLVELENSVPDLASNYFDLIGHALDRAAYSYEISVEEMSLVPAPDVIPRLVKTYIVVKKKTEGLSDGALENYSRTLKSRKRTFVVNT